MAVIKTKTKFTKSKFTKNKYSTKKKNVSRMTKKKNVMKGGMKTTMSRSMSRSKSGKPPGSGAKPFNTKYVNIAPNKAIINNNIVKKYFLGEGKKLNTGSRFARINIDKLKTYLQKTTNLDQQKSIIFNTLRGKYEPAIVKYASGNPKMFTNLLEKEATFQREMEGLYMDPQTLVF